MGTGAHYAPSTRRIALWDQITGADQNAVLVHEYTHAIQDANTGLVSYSDTGEYDTGLAARSLLEGQAVWAQLETGKALGLLYPSWKQHQSALVASAEAKYLASKLSSLSILASPTPTAPRT